MKINIFIITFLFSQLALANIHIDDIVSIKTKDSIVFNMDEVRSVVVNKNYSLKELDYLILNDGLIIFKQDIKSVQTSNLNLDNVLMDRPAGDIDGGGGWFWLSLN